MLYQPKLSLALLLSSTLAISGCSIQDETSQEIKVEKQEIIKAKAKTKTQRFVNMCSECILGDLSNLDKIIDTYQSSFTNKTSYPKGAFLYQRITPTLSFERCAQKAMISGDDRAFKAMFIRQGKIARTARYFYATNKPTQGAFWLQRLINVKGEMDGLEVAGRVFIQDIRTIGIGVRLLEQSARLGNRNARQMLMGLMNPGSIYYQQLTKNRFNEDQGDHSDAGIEKFDAMLDDKPKPDKKSVTILDDDDISDNIDVARRLTDSEANSKSKIEEVGSGNIAIYDSNSHNQNSLNSNDNTLNELAVPKNMGLGYSETAIKENNKVPYNSDPNQQEQNIIHSNEATINALQSSDPELDVPLEIYEKDHETHKQNRLLHHDNKVNTIDGSINKSYFDPKVNHEREQMLKSLEKKALEASKAAQQRAQEAKTAP